MKTKDSFGLHTMLGLKQAMRFLVVCFSATSVTHLSVFAQIISFLGLLLITRRTCLVRDEHMSRRRHTVLKGIHMIVSLSGEARKHVAAVFAYARSVVNDTYVRGVERSRLRRM